MVTPWLSASAGVAKETSRPSSVMRPALLWVTPAMILVRVDFPAPFSPTRAWISPCFRIKSTEFRARTPRYSLVTPCISIRALIASSFAPVANVKRERHAAALASDQYFLTDAQRTGQAVPLAISAAVRASQGGKCPIEFDQHSVRTRRRPGLVDAQMPHRTALEGFLKTMATRQSGRHPEILGNIADHLFQEVRLPKHELNHLAAGREETEPVAAIPIG